MVNENTIFSVMREVCNFFIRRDDIRCYEGEVTIDSDYRINIDVPSPYIIIRGSKKNDGLYYMIDEHLIHPRIFVEGDPHPLPETFNGRIWFSYPTQDFIELCEKINTYQLSVNVTAKPIVSESFGSSSRTYSRGSNGGVVTWQENFGNALRSYRNHMFWEIY